MAASLKKVFSALNRPGKVSLCRDVLGFLNDRVPAAISAMRPKPGISMSQFIRLLRNRHFHVRLIVTGSDLLNVNDRKALDYDVFRLRDIYSAGEIGIGIVSWDLRTARNSGSRAIVRTADDMAATGHDITADGDFVPVVLPADMNVTVANPDGSVTVALGLSPTSGPCSPRVSDGMNSSVVDFAGETAGRVLAHEVGHYLGASHPATADNNLMAQEAAVRNAGGDPFNATLITANDRAIMKNHCVMRRGLPV